MSSQGYLAARHQQVAGHDNRPTPPAQARRSPRNNKIGRVATALTPKTPLSSSAIPRFDSLSPGSDVDNPIDAPPGRSSAGRDSKISVSSGSIATTIRQGRSQSIESSPELQTGSPAKLPIRRTRPVEQNRRSIRPSQSRGETPTSFVAGRTKQPRNERHSSAPAAPSSSAIPITRRTASNPALHRASASSAHKERTLSAKNIDDALIGRIHKPLKQYARHFDDSDDEKTGSLYVFRDCNPSKAGQLKIGYTTQLLSNRQKELEKQCSTELEIVYYTKRIRDYDRAEKLTHLDLAAFCRPFSCSSCKKKDGTPRMHREYFEVNEDTAIKTVKRWTRFLELKPYEERGRLRKEWFRRLNDLEDASTRDDPLDHEAHWRRWSIVCTDLSSSNVTIESTGPTSNPSSLGDRNVPILPSNRQMSHNADSGIESPIAPLTTPRAPISRTTASPVTCHTPSVVVNVHPTIRLGRTASLQVTHAGYTVPWFVFLASLLGLLLANSVVSFS
ncbi:T5orf172 domain-containing protein [Lophiotrema nucula]|uniref:T5orf172 domain-containing protein n=1 Tax=Lophiotrema nucula TaxID=690887 RepID=A0A6A5Z2V9_9PLEO|nr:T5orf172 domain-containing protein [Lophiotrema nucula]